MCDSPVSFNNTDILIAWAIPHELPDHCSRPATGPRWKPLPDLTRRFRRIERRSLHPGGCAPRLDGRPVAVSERVGINDEFGDIDIRILLLKINGGRRSGAGPGEHAAGNEPARR